MNRANSPSVTAYGPGLSYGVANKTASFTVFTEDASEGPPAAVEPVVEGSASGGCDHEGRGTFLVSRIL